MAALTAGGGLVLAAAAPASATAAATTAGCTDGSSPAAHSTVTCTTAGHYTLAVPAGTTSVGVDVAGAGGGAGNALFDYEGRHNGGDGGEVSGTLRLPPGTRYLYVTVGAGGSGDTGGPTSGAGGSGVFALAADKSSLGRLVIAGAGGSGAYDGGGGDAGQPGTVFGHVAAFGSAWAGQPALAGVGGSGGQYSSTNDRIQNGSAGESADPDPSSLAIASGAPGSTYAQFYFDYDLAAGHGGGGYAGGGSSGTWSWSHDINSLGDGGSGGGGGGSSYASTWFLSPPATAVKTGTGGVWGSSTSGAGAPGAVTMTFQGSPPVVGVNSPIQTKYLALGGASSFLGAPLGADYPVAGGRAQSYRGGLIAWSPATGAWSVHGAILDKYRSMGGPGGLLGFPTSDEKATLVGGRINHFSGAGGASVLWSPATGAWSVHGAIRSKYLAIGGPAVLGFPTTDERTTAGDTGRYNHFSGAGGASIFWSPRTGAWSVHGAIRTAWIRLAAERGRLGYPTSDEFGVGAARRSTFAGGTVTWLGRTTVTYKR